MAVEHWGISVSNLVRVVQDDNLSNERSTLRSGLVLAVRYDVSSLDVLDGDVSNVESDVVTWDGLGEDFVVHFDLLALRTES